MVAAALCMALYSIWSRPFIRRSGPIPFTTMSMGGRSALPDPGLVVARQLCAGCRRSARRNGGAAFYLGAFGAALTFYLWAFALERTTPTRVAISVTVNPVTASLVGAVLLDEPLSWNLVGRHRDGVRRHLDRDDHRRPRPASACLSARYSLATDRIRHED